MFEHRPLQSQLSRYQPQNPATEEELFEKAKKAWIERGLLFVNPKCEHNEFLRQYLINLGNELYGVRK